MHAKNLIIAKVLAHIQLQLLDIDISIHIPYAHPHTRHRRFMGDMQNPFFRLGLVRMWDPVSLMGIGIAANSSTFSIFRFTASLFSSQASSNLLISDSIANWRVVWMEVLVVGAVTYMDETIDESQTI